MCKSTMSDVSVIELSGNNAPIGAEGSSVADSIAKKREECRMKVAGTNIDSRSLLSTDYFNMFNSVIMVLDMLPDMPEMLEEVEQWKFVDYVEHFKISGLDFSDLAIEAYGYVSPDVRETFEHKVNGIRAIIEHTAKILRELLNNGELVAFKNIIHSTVDHLHAMIEEGHGIVHGGGTMDQSAIDKLF